MQLKQRRILICIKLWEESWWCQFGGIAISLT